MKAIRLRTEYLNDPIGIDFPHPRLFWNCEGGVRQTAYQIMAESDGSVAWDSGKVESARMTHIPFEGTLTSRMRMMWKVRLWDENGGPGDWSEPAVFEMGLLEASDWKANWITGNYKADKKRRFPVDCFRKTFPAEGIVKARLYVAACGVYEGELNGKRIGDFILAPGHTDYTKRIQCQTYDVFPLLKDGENELTFLLADGWYRGSCGAWGLRNQYGTETKLLAQLELTDAQGKKTTLRTGGSWQWSNDGPIRFTDNQDGEVFNANCTPSYSGRAKVTSCSVVPAASNNVPITEHETFTPKLLTTPAGKQVLDFGQNCSWHIRKQHDRQPPRYSEALRLSPSASLSVLHLRFTPHRLLCRYILQDFQSSQPMQPRIKFL